LPTWQRPLATRQDGNAQYRRYVSGVCEFTRFRPILCCRGQIQHHAPFDLTCPEVGEDRIDVTQWRFLYLGSHFAFGGKCDGLVEVATNKARGK
jgi:hypothetical protein